MYKYLLLLVFVFCCLAIHAQHPERNRANIWHFGNSAGLDFSSGNPVAGTNSQMYAGEACSSISDVNGNLLFYTDGDSIWDKNHNVMPNGYGLNGCESSAQGALIIPLPGNNSLYYVFTTDCENFFGTGLRYSMVDLTLNSGLGDVVNSQKNIFLTDSVIECLTAVEICNTVWLMAHKGNSNEFYFYKITNQGIDNIPIINAIGSTPYYVSSAKFSPSGKKLVLVSGFSSPAFIELYDFNGGTLSNTLSLSSLSGEYGVEFSQDERMLYVSTNGNMIFQFDISSNNQSTINSSRILIYDSFDNSTFFGIQNATNGKIYISSANTPAISEIDNPNNQGIACNFNFLNILTNGRLSSLGLPNYNTSYFDQSYNEANCYNDEISFTIPNAISPNGDGINDDFSIKIAGCKKINYYIYNRWGSLLIKNEIELETIQEQVIKLWDATYNNNPVTDGVYYYVIELTYVNETKENKNGFIHLMR